MSEITRKTCSRCKIEKHVTDFYKRSQSKDGLNGICRKCSNTAQKAEYKATHVKRWANLKF